MSKQDDTSHESFPEGIFALSSKAEDAKIHLIPVPWEVTTSYGHGTSNGPAAILRASQQVDLFDLEVGSAHETGYFMKPISSAWMKRNLELKALAQGQPSETAREKINRASVELNSWVEQQAMECLAKGKIAAVIGGDHSSPYGLIKALHQKLDGDFGILHIDAHADLRVAYQGFKHSHASIMHNVVQDLAPRCLVQVGIRDFSPEEYAFSESRRSLSGEIGSGRIVTHYDRGIKKRLFNGEPFHAIVRSILTDLPKNVYVSFDIDGLDPSLCPNTGTPVPGGLAFDHVLSIFSLLAESGRRIVGFDLNEVSEPTPGSAEWDANVGARILFKLCGWTAITNGFAKMPSENRGTKHE